MPDVQVVSAAEERGLGAPMAEAFEATTGGGAQGAVDGVRYVIGSPAFIEKVRGTTSTRIGSGLTVVTAALLSQQEALPVVGQDSPGGLRTFRDPPTLPPHDRQGNSTALVVLTDAVVLRPTVLNSRGV